MIIDAENLIMGRMATYAAKKALSGEDVFIVNCEKAVITGNKYWLFKDYQRKRTMGTFKGPFVNRLPEKFVKRVIRGMLPYKKDKGMNALKRVKCYKGVPEKFKDQKFEKLEDCHSKKLKTSAYVYVYDVCKNLGAKI